MLKPPLTFKHRLVLPLLLSLVLILGYPLAFSLWISLHDYRLTAIEQARWVGWAQYFTILTQNASFWNALANTLRFVGMAVSLELVFGLLLALLLHRKATPFRHFFRAVLLVPMFVTPIAVGLMFRFLLNSQLGVVPSVLRALGITIDWFSAQQALITLALIDVWQWTPFMLLLLLAGLESLPEEPFEAARVDGASSLQIFWHLTLPMLRPTILAAVVIRMLDAFKVYEYVYAITRGGPGESTETIQYHIYRVGFLYFRLGEASAMSYILIAVILMLVVLLFYALRRESLSQR
ncbi:MAG: sugar ABC transporter permease [Chloroflexi bacterium]|uniref:Sugar ABC transporter permease n=1 Tax=Candidatus Thermofonsia Clade 3 bacterium TaxID=2364212 RepID=A0A2M8QGV3_9CHLR|nr:sugar ABC transporter permease [Candidatus Roseilinea sp. NK_OTU-006]PJF49030.1 MAG: sugar ABC transporter permease [Candidatus Thermofonsia Clade 3 bacterium]RMG63454.1 MAG: sugar ABC transporter permease [Chloroflexota bacterium]